MKTPIEPIDIRVDDLIRYEFGSMPGSASEWRAEVEGISPYQARAGQHYLLDRPKPAVELPTIPSLGWVTTDLGFRDGATLAFVGQWKKGSDAMTADYGHGYRRISGLYGGRENVTAFTPATAVPTEALDELRAEWPYPDGAVHAFLTAVDAANEPRA